MITIVTFKGVQWTGLEKWKICQPHFVSVRSIFNVITQILTTQSDRLIISIKISGKEMLALTSFLAMTFLDYNFSMELPNSIIIGLYFTQYSIEELLLIQMEI